MAKSNNKKHMDNLTPFSSTNQPNNSGRKKKIYSILKEHGYSKDDITTAFGELAFYTEKDLNALLRDNTKPIIVKIVAKALKKALEYGDWSKIKDIIEHVIGKAKQKIEQVVHTKEIDRTIEEVEAELKELDRLNN